MKRVLIFGYGLLSYALGLAGLTWFILYVGGWSFLPLHIDSRQPGPLLPALLINLGLMLLFGLQHSLMARQSFKQHWTRIIPPTAERSTYVLLSGVILGLFCLYWQPLPGTLWHISNPVGHTLLLGGYVAGWIIAVIATFLINHFELFGLQQVYCQLRQQAMPRPHFTDRLLYRVVRHPLQLGILIGLWSTPTMSMTHLLLATTMSLYIFIGLHYEEKDLLKYLGDDYAQYCQRVRMLVPIPK